MQAVATSLSPDGLQPELSLADSSAPSCCADDGELTALLAQTLRSTATGVALAWHFRQRDGAQALQFAADAALANAVDISPEARISMQVRVQLVRAEVATASRAAGCGRAYFALAARRCHHDRAAILP